MIESFFGLLVREIEGTTFAAPHHVKSASQNVCHNS